MENKLDAAMVDAAMVDAAMEIPATCSAMARQPRFEYPGAVYHIMARGDGGKAIFERNDDHESFLHWLERACDSHGWKIHAWVLMGNHFHLLLETPEPNLSAGMKFLMGRFAQAWNFRRQRRGHVFQGRYKAVPVAGEAAADAHYFKCVADYIHLKPARAGLAGGQHGSLVAYPWSSLRHYPRGNPPAWQPLERVLDAFQLDQKSRGRRAYLSWLEARAASDDGKIDEVAMSALRRGWYLGEDRFRDRLLNLLHPGALRKRTPSSHAGDAIRDFGHKEAEVIIRQIGAEIGLPNSLPELVQLRKGDSRKVVCAALVKSRTSVTNEWLATRLAMGHPASMSKHVHQLRREPAGMKILKKYEKTLKSED